MLEEKEPIITTLCKTKQPEGQRADVTECKLKIAENQLHKERVILVEELNPKLEEAANDYKEQLWTHKATCVIIETNIEALLAQLN